MVRTAAVLSGCSSSMPSTCRWWAPGCLLSILHQSPWERLPPGRSADGGWYGGNTPSGRAA